jgi:hypothetical protein
MRSLALAGADLVACPARLAWPPVRPWGATAVPMDPGVEAGPTADHFHLGRERARENATWLLYANAPSCGGWSACFGPDPEHPPRVEALVPSAAAGIAALEIDTGEPDPATPTTTNPCRAKPMLRMRVPFWYDPVGDAGHGNGGGTRPSRAASSEGWGPARRRTNPPLGSRRGTRPAIPPVELDALPEVGLPPHPELLHHPPGSDVLRLAGGDDPVQPQLSNPWRSSCVAASVA